MQYYDIQPDLTKAMPILSETNLVLSNEVDAHKVHDILIRDLLPGAFSMLGTKLRLTLVTVMLYNNIAYWDLIFEYPKDYDRLNLLEAIFNNSIELDDSFDHNQFGGEGIHKISFKVG